jgi:hypothetical protein
MWKRLRLGTFGSATPSLTGTWEVVGRPTTQCGRKEVRVKVQRPGEPHASFRLWFFIMPSRCLYSLLPTSRRETRSVKLLFGGRRAVAGRTSPWNDFVGSGVADGEGNPRRVNVARDERKRVRVECRGA